LLAPQSKPICVNTGVGVRTCTQNSDLLMSHTLRLIPIVLLAIVVADAATLQQLSMDQMNQLATSVVRARVIGLSSDFVATAGSPTIYTHYKLAVSEVWKGVATTEVALPGGDVKGVKQSFPGVPDLRVGGEYVLYLWKSPSTGIVHTLGLTQGIFELATGADGSVVASRKQSGETILDASGHRVSDRAVSMKLADLRSRAGVSK
jgi:hypothetical protein